MTTLMQSHVTGALSGEEETALVARVKAGDQVACARLVTLFGPQMMAVARRFMDCDDDCNDALQEAFISAFRALDRFAAHSRLATWLHRITVNSCLMKLRNGSSAGNISFESFEELLPTSAWRRPHPHGTAIDDPLSEIETDERRALVRHAIDQLPGPYRAVLLLRDIEELDTAATAALLNTSPHNVKRRLHRARQALGTLLVPIMT